MAQSWNESQLNVFQNFVIVACFFYSFLVLQCVPDDREKIFIIFFIDVVLNWMEFLIVFSRVFCFQLHEIRRSQDGTPTVLLAMEIPSQQFADNVLAIAGPWMLLRCDIGMRGPHTESTPSRIMRLQYIFRFDFNQRVQRQGSNSYHEGLQIRWHQVFNRIHVQRRN